MQRTQQILGRLQEHLLQIQDSVSRGDYETLLMLEKDTEPLQRDCAALSTEETQHFSKEFNILHEQLGVLIEQMQRRREEVAVLLGGARDAAGAAKAYAKSSLAMGSKSK